MILLRPRESVAENDGASLARELVCTTRGLLSIGEVAVQTPRQALEEALGAVTRQTLE